jgi:8-amino-7-oxononanoate synthase
VSAPLDWLADVERQRTAAGLRRLLVAREADFDGLLDLASNDYLGLTRHPAVVEAAAEATRVWGAGATGSRLVTGSTRLHHELDDELAAFAGTEAAVVVSSGYAANLAAITALAPAGTVILSDRGNHASIIDACRLARGRAEIVPHRDTGALREALAAATTAAHRLVVTDAVFSVDGDAAHVRDALDAAVGGDAAIVVDEAHSLGVAGPGGRGLVAPALAALPDRARDAVVITATLSKALGSQGGVILGPRAVIEHIVDQARPFIFDTGLAPTSVGAALAALRLIVQHPELPARAVANAAALASLAESVGLRATAPDAAVVSIRIGAPDAALAAQRMCREHGVLVGCFRPPSVPDDDSRLRLTARADLDEPDLARAGAALAAVAAWMEAQQRG